MRGDGSTRTPYDEDVIYCMTDRKKTATRAQYHLELYGIMT